MATIGFLQRVKMRPVERRAAKRLIELMTEESRALGKNAFSRSIIKRACKRFNDEETLRVSRAKKPGNAVRIEITVEREDDGRYIGAAPSRGILLYGDTRAEAVQKVKATVFAILADRIEHGEEEAPSSLTFVVNRS